MAKFGTNPSDTQESWGQFGDFVGGILNPLFSIIGLLALLHTIVLQSKELSKSTRELKASAKALRRQNKHNARQQFDNNFFQLLTLNVSLVPTIALSDGPALTGEAAFQRAVKKFVNGWDIDSADDNEWIERFDSWHSEMAFVFDTYIHSLSNVLSFIVEADVSSRAKEGAYITVSSNFSSAVLTVLFLFCTLSPEHNWFREDLEESRFFGWCQMDEINFFPVWRDLRPFSRVEFNTVNSLDANDK